MLATIFTGRTGAYLANEFKKKGSDVTILINLHGLGAQKKVFAKGIKVIPFRYLEEFSSALIKELKKTRYDMIIHSAAVSDYKLKKTFKGKIPSGKNELNLNFKSAQKMIGAIRTLAKNSILVQFKLEIKRAGLLNRAYKSLVANKSDFCVANALEDLRLGYKAFLLDKEKQVKVIHSKKELLRSLYHLL